MGLKWSFRKRPWAKTVDALFVRAYGIDMVDAGMPEARRGRGFGWRGGCWDKLTLVIENNKYGIAS